MTLGPQGFFGYGVCSSNLLNPTAGNETPVIESSAIASPSHSSFSAVSQAVWWSTYSSVQVPNTRNFDRDEIRAQLQFRHGAWADPTIRSIVASAVVDSVYPTWVTPELPTWERHSVVLIGDAAHALPSSSGQGASQAVEDAQMLALLLARFLSKNPRDPNDGDGMTKSISQDTHSAAEKVALTQALKVYFQLRHPRVKRIADRAKYAGDAKRKRGFIGEWVIYFFIWLIGAFFFLFFLPSPRIRAIRQVGELRNRLGIVLHFFSQRNGYIKS